MCSRYVSLPRQEIAAGCSQVSGADACVLVCFSFAQQPLLDLSISPTLHLRRMLSLGKYWICPIRHGLRILQIWTLRLTRGQVTSDENKIFLLFPPPPMRRFRCSLVARRLAEASCQRWPGERPALAAGASAASMSASQARELDHI